DPRPRRLVPTRRGWSAAVGAVLLWLVGRLLGLVELDVLAVAALVALLSGVVYVRVVRFSLDARRQARPARVHFGQPCRIDLVLTNPRTRRTPAVVAEEPFDDGRLLARFEVPALAPRASGRAAYRIPTDRRGRFVTGPIRLRLTDPLGMASAQHRTGASATVLVYPRIDPVSGMPPAPGNDPHWGVHQRAGRLQGEDFYALRPYEVGDDLRRVHWPATARADDLMIRQLELPWQHRTTVLLDVRRGVYGDDAFETAASAAASILAGSHARGALTRLATTAGLDSGFEASMAHLDAELGALAGVKVTGAANLATSLAGLRRHGPGSSVAVVTTTASSPADLQAVARLRTYVGLVVLVLVDTGGAPPLAGAGLSEIRVVRIGPGRTLADAWPAVFASSRSRLRAGRGVAR
ncbi:MAG TPA: DUF58 domain-containing protein, partial [Acidimicrobiales bacterium]|nr:DUF58 domain-containing protein [Acidimicrobiales bacterium]